MRVQSVWRFAIPALKNIKCMLQSLLFVGITEDSKCCGKNLEDLWKSKCEFKEIQDLDINDNTLCSWQEIREMYNSGFVDIESHTLFHREIFKNINITDYISSNIPLVPYNFRGSPYFKLMM